MLNDPGAMQLAVAEKRTQTGGDWFFWIAGFSVVNSVLALVGANFHFVIGLGTTEVIDSIFSGRGGVGRGISLALDILAAAFYVGYGLFARKGAKWAFIVGMVFYALDGALLLFAQDWLSVAFHAYALYRIFQGFQAAQELGRLRAQAVPAAGGYALPPPASDVWPPPPAA